MQLQTHLISGWCFANLFRLDRRERLLCMLVALVPDLDGIGILLDVRYYHRYHHVLGHNLLAAVIISAGLALFSRHRLRAGLAYFAVFQVHIALDLLGSGTGWGVYYLWPFSDWYLENPHVWELQSWQTTVTLVLFIVWTFHIAYRQERTPFELIAPALDTAAVSWIVSFVQR